MPLELPEVIAGYLASANAHDAEACASFFTEDAIVHDEGQEYRGITAIKNWFASTARKYAFTLTPIHLSRQENEMILTAKMTGEFPGSPISARFQFVLDEGKIAKLNIRA